ncbi:fumarylacetoacetate hydrolase family protein [Shewanella gelidii]|uniref:2-keto-4-pentenoate hydratase n=1 Tax=Shewanella gelidii TaxID=1642821 RepID=A0A917N797_9GAMM|nr:fumarylacetoacetate hydrolase family protein [Shewanella gelidii]MCL1097260.1 fumarylacetoacetate hydrolase family protein [Shewanella gelidii]GGI73710.1 2-keto-4-pentenoate hydratase [Shewanella gelidii]
MNSIVFDKQTITPTKVVCVGRNYVDHIHELNNEIPDEMVIFVKPNSAISKDLLVGIDEPIHYEAELCFLCQDQSFVGVGLGLDLTKRQLQSKLKAKGLPWERAKSFDGAAVLTSFVAIPTTVEALRFTLKIDDELVQMGDVALMMNTPEAIRQEIRSFMSLADGDVVMTGTPKGVGVVHGGACFELSLFDGETCIVNQQFKAMQPTQ